MNKIIRKLLIWALKRKIRAFYVARVVSADEMNQSKENILAYTRADMLKSLADELFKEGFIKEELFPNKQQDAVEIRMKIHVLR